MPKYIVRYGTMRTLGVMTARTDASFRRSDEVIVRSDRGLEIGQVLCEASDDALSHLDKPAVGSIIRQVSDEDAAGVNDIDGARQKKLDVCERHIQALGLEMKLIEVEQLFGGERLIAYYIAEERVDFRELVRLLAAEFKTRIEMRQIGVRDEAKLLADYGDCGKPVCCNTHLSAMPPVSMKMAKLQKATLDPTKISGRCGRLKCCLRYEYDQYVDLQRTLPKVGARVVTRNGTMKVLNQQILAEQLLVETEDHRRMVIDASEVLSTLPAGATPKIEPAATEETGEAGSNDRERKKSRRPRRRRKPASSTDSNPGSKDRGAAKNDQGSNKTDSPEKNPQASTDGETTTKKPRRNRSNRNRRRRSKRKPKSDDQS